ncbi:MAG TPA: oxygen-independent coproporphyrinogen III oxidase-like protein, partial [Accumulibacter sp.]|nr:oxygen-independent coproporphyrinogen III oxidase-like protein [Accumulibacter sp.]
MATGDRRQTIPLRRVTSESDLDAPLQFRSLPPLTLYIHVPWCVRKCPYCDFNSHALTGGPTDSLPENEYLAALVADLESALPQIWGRRVDSLFIGGGTPSLLSGEGVDRLLADCRSRLPVRPD